MQDVKLVELYDQKREHQKDQINELDKLVRKKN
jgi:hypothetical protein